METKAYNFRLPEQVNEHLNELARVAGMTRTQFVVGAIEQRWDEYQGNPKMRAIMEQLQSVREQLLGAVGQVQEKESLPDGKE